MMKKTTFLQKLAATKVTKDNTVAEAREAQRIKRELEAYLRKAAATHIRETEGDELNEANWITVKYEFNLNPTGSVIVKVFNADAPMVPVKELRRYNVPKRYLFK